MIFSLCPSLLVKHAYISVPCPWSSGKTVFRQCVFWWQCGSHHNHVNHVNHVLLPKAFCLHFGDLNLPSTDLQEHGLVGILSLMWMQEKLFQADQIEGAGYRIVSLGKSSLSQVFLSYHHNLQDSWEFVFGFRFFPMIITCEYWVEEHLGSVNNLSDC